MRAGLRNITTQPDTTNPPGWVGLTRGLSLGDYLTRLGTYIRPGQVLRWAGFLLLIMISITKNNWLNGTYKSYGEFYNNSRYKKERRSLNNYLGIRIIPLRAFRCY